MRSGCVDRDSETVVKYLAIAVVLFVFQFVFAWWHGPIRTREECELFDTVVRAEPNMPVFRDCTIYPIAKSLADAKADENAK
jgi:hypothetical protein